MHTDYTLCNITHCVLYYKYYTLCVKLHIVCKVTHNMCIGKYNHFEHLAFGRWTLLHIENK